MIRTQEISLRAVNVRNASMSDQSIDAAVNGNTKMLKVQYRAWFDSSLPDPYLVNSLLLG